MSDDIKLRQRTPEEREAYYIAQIAGLKHSLVVATSPLAEKLAKAWRDYETEHYHVYPWGGYINPNEPEVVAMRDRYIATARAALAEVLR